MSNEYAVGMRHRFKRALESAHAEFIPENGQRAGPAVALRYRANLKFYGWRTTKTENLAWRTIRAAFEPIR